MGSIDEPPRSFTILASPAAAWGASRCASGRRMTVAPLFIGEGTIQEGTGHEASRSRAPSHDFLAVDMPAVRRSQEPSP